MRVSASLLAVVGTAAGAVAAVVAYQAGSGAVAAPASSSQDKATRSSTVAPSVAARTTFLPCDKGTKLRKGVCVRVKHKIVVVTDPAPAAPPAVVNARATTGRHGYGSTADRGGREPKQREHAAGTGGDDRAHADENGHEDEDAAEGDHGDESDEAREVEPRE